MTVLGSPKCQLRDAITIGYEVMSDMYGTTSNVEEEVGAK
jgi:hypothetical protein